MIKMPWGLNENLWGPALAQAPLVGDPWLEDPGLTDTKSVKFLVRKMSSHEGSISEMIITSLFLVTICLEHTINLFSH